MSVDRILLETGDILLLETGDKLLNESSTASSPATAITLSGPSSGDYNAASTNFTVGADGTITGTITVTPTSSAGTGSFTPTTVQISSGAPTATFTYTPTSVGARNINCTNDGGLNAPSNVAYTANATVPAAPTIGTAVEDAGHDGTVDVAFTANSNGGASVTAANATGSLGDNGSSGGSSPIVVTIAAANKGASQTWTVTQTNSVGASSASSASNGISATTVPGAPTSVVGTPGNTQVSITGTAPTDTGGLSLTYIGRFEGGTPTSAGARPRVVTGLTNGVAGTPELQAVNSLGSSSFATGSDVTPSAFTPYAGCATFDGTSNHSLAVATLAVTQSYPFWVRADVQVAAFPYLTTGVGNAEPGFCIWSSEKTSGNFHGTCGILNYGLIPTVAVGDGTAFSTGINQESAIPAPYWEPIVWEFRSTTDHRVTIRNRTTYTGQNTTSRAISIATGALTVIGQRANGAVQKFYGAIGNVVFGSGTLDTAGMELASTVGGNYANITATGGAPTNWYPCAEDGEDVIGSDDMTVNSVSFGTDTPADIASPTVAQAINQIRKTTTLRTGSPTITTSQAAPISVSGWTNYLRTDHYTISFTGNCGAWDTLIYLMRPTSANGHLVLVDHGHADVSLSDDYGSDVLVEQLIADGYTVGWAVMPGMGVNDPGYPGAGVYFDHNDYISEINDTDNPLERWIDPVSVFLDSVSGSFTKISAVGLSGGGHRWVHYAALDNRINHAVVCVRGTIADRRHALGGDFEQWPYPNYWKVEEFYRLCAYNGGTNNRRLVLVHHATDSCCFAEEWADPNGAGRRGGAYLDATDYDTQFLAPIRAEFQNSDIQIQLDTGISTHSFTQEAIDDIIFPALEDDLVNSTIGVWTIARGMSGGMSVHSGGMQV